ncbi:DUF1638 domain-containing protein [Anoxybacterium hadale]|uniref:DUF1638 domain-containing protein n=1 Tax=Anoxybacterium hadale TaxID=3408580 RepID=A0ACD1A7F3_9FIRM|nr:DUF1638 domain-containing protein [Clostridiales bacterium]
MNSVLIACSTISSEIECLIRESACPYPVLWIPSGLHNSPELLRKRLQEELDHLSNIERVLMAFGYCGNALVGLIPPSFEMIFPRTDDCISLLLGSSLIRKEISQSAGTYFLTKGWLENEKTIWHEYQQSISRYGKERTDRMFRQLLKHYERLGIIETRAYSLEGVLESSQEIGKTLQLRIEVIPGTLDYLKKLLTGPWDDDFIVIRPGTAVTLSHIYGD